MPTDRSIADVLQDVVRNLQEIVRAEVRLAKTELREEAVKAKPAGTLLGTGALFGLFAAFFFLLSAVYALTRVMPDWAAALTVAALTAVVAASTLAAGKKRLTQVHPVPEKTVASIKESVEWAKRQTR